MCLVSVWEMSVTVVLYHCGRIHLLVGCECAGKIGLV